MAINEIICSGTYIGDQPLLKNKSALLQYKKGESLVGAQFDDLSLPHELIYSISTCGWALFRQQDFAVDIDYSPLLAYLN